MERSRIEAAILDLLAERGPGKSACPSEAARRLAEDWRPLMPQVREAAANLAAEGRIVVTQGDEEVDPQGADGPIRLRPPPE